ncbi:MAG: ATP-binding protein [Gemmatimonadales bacterium]|jgi:signal transduction histidine kinase/CheY-like chemotaxis protein
MMPRGVHNQLAVYLGDLFAVAGAALLAFDAWRMLPHGGGSGTLAADLALVATGLVARRVAEGAHREAPVVALACLIAGSLIVLWLTERWWVPTAAGAVAAAVAPQFLPARRAMIWSVAGALLGFSGIVAGLATALVAVGAVAAVSAVSFRLAAALRAAASQGAADLDRALELERRRAAQILARLKRFEARSQAGAQGSVARAVLTRQLGAVQEAAQGIAWDLKRVLSLAEPEAIAAAAHRNAERAEQLARLAAGGEVRERETTLALVWPRVLDHLRPESGETHRFEVSLPEALPPVAGGNEAWAQILAALVQHAVEATPGGGIVNVTADSSDRPGFARVAVRDNGPGVPGELPPHALEPSYASRAERGSQGLGLATVASLVEALGGAMHITSAPGSGTTVEIEVPFCATGGRPAAAEPMRLQGAVLVADDDKDVRRSLVRLLESFGAEAVDVDSGTVALAYLNVRPERFRAAILDVVMQGTPVPEIVMAVREQRPSFPFLLISGLASARLLDNLLALGGVRFLKKPFTREELFYTLRDLFTVEAPAAGG